MPRHTSTPMRFEAFTFKSKGRAYLSRLRNVFLHWTAIVGAAPDSVL